MTLIIMTDLVWAGTADPQELERTFVDFLKDNRISRHVGGRWVTLQFVSLGEARVDKLDRLDNSLKAEYHIRYVYLLLSCWPELTFSSSDVVDHEPVSGSVDEMILGRLNQKYDEQHSGSSSVHSRPIAPGRSVTC